MKTFTTVIAMVLTLGLVSAPALADSANWSDEKLLQVERNRCANAGMGDGTELLINVIFGNLPPEYVPTNGGFKKPEAFKTYIADMAKKGFDVKFEANLQKAFISAGDLDIGFDGCMPSTISFWNWTYA